MTYDRIEENTGVPADILERSGKARAEADGKTEAEVIGDWAGVEVPAEAAPAEAAPTEAPAAAAEALPPVESLSGEALLAAAAEAKGIPLSLVERSAQARADADGVPVEQVMREWVVEAGLAAAGAAPRPEPAPPTPEPAPAQPPEAAPSAPPPAEPEELGVEVLAPVAPAEGEAAVPEPEPAPIRPGRYPAWLAASLVVIPLVAVLYVLIVPNQPSCGSAGQVGVDPATGLHANCDGSPYGERGAGNVLAGGEIFAASCAVCHGDAGQGTGAGPAMAGGAVLETFPEGSCATHIEWVSLGSLGWPDQTYGAQGKPVQGFGVMPPFAATLSEEEIAQVALYERVAFGGEDEAVGETDCGFAEGESGGGA